MGSLHMVPRHAARIVRGKNVDGSTSSTQINPNNAANTGKFKLWRSSCNDICCLICNPQRKLVLMRAALIFQSSGGQIQISGITCGTDEHCASPNSRLDLVDEIRLETEPLESIIIFSLVSFPLERPKVIGGLPTCTVKDEKAATIIPSTISLM